MTECGQKLAVERFKLGLREPDIKRGMIASVETDLSIMEMQCVNMEKLINKDRTVNRANSADNRRGVSHNNNNSRPPNNYGQRNDYGKRDYRLDMQKM